MYHVRHACRAISVELLHERLCASCWVSSLPLGAGCANRGEHQLCSQGPDSTRHDRLFAHVRTIVRARVHACVSEPVGAWHVCASWKYVDLLHQSCGVSQCSPASRSLWHALLPLQTLAARASFQNVARQVLSLQFMHVCAHSRACLCLCLCLCCTGSVWGRASCQSIHACPAPLSEM